MTQSRHYEELSNPVYTSYYYEQQTDEIQKARLQTLIVLSAFGAMGVEAHYRLPFSSHQNS